MTMPARGKRRALGQHFLRDQAIAQRIAEVAVEEMEKHHCTAMLEIGPGKGAITHPLIHLMKATDLPFILAEKDFKFADDWKEYRFEYGKLQVEPGDFLDLEEDRWLKHAPLAVVSNLPYSSGTAILQRLARRHDVIPVMVLMFQAEVARRLRAEPNTREWGSLSIWIQNRWDVKRLVHVPPGAFAPPPRVDSEVVTMHRRAHPRIRLETPEDERLWERLLKTAFAQRRKMLRSSLARQAPYGNALARSGLDDTKRAEALKWEDWDRLFQALREESSR